MPSLAAIILNWEDSASTIRCGNSVIISLAKLSSLGYKYRVYIVDNGSSKIEVEKLREWVNLYSKRKVALIENKTNLGFSAGMNAGIAPALDSNPLYFWLLNNDTIVDSEAANRLVTYMESNPDVVMAGATIVDQAGKQILCSGGHRYYKWLGYNRPLNMGTPIKDLKDIEEPKLDYIDGAAMCLHGSLVRRIGGLPNKYYLYFEELNLNSYLLEGERIGWCRNSIVHHESGSSSPTPQLKERSTYHAALSTFRYTYRHHPVCVPTVILARLVGISARAIIRRQPGLVLAVFRALKDFLLHLPAEMT